MNVSFQHVNPEASHDATLLTVRPEDDPPARFLVDAGEDVSPRAFLSYDESLDGVFLTHAHRDHYASLSQALDGSDAPLYTSEPTARILEQVYTEADRYQDLGDPETVEDALTPIDGWTELTDSVAVLPVPAGHTPGAVGFLFRVDDLAANDETVTILATGDFTTQPVAGYPGLTVPDSIDLDVVIANAGTAEAFTDNLVDATDAILERALGGATTLVAASGFTGVHAAYLLGHLLAEIDRSLPITVVGQAAKHYSALEYDVPNVTARPQFTDTTDVMRTGGITIAGPEAPTQGSTNRLFGTIRDDPDSVFVQLSTSGADPVDDAACATHYYSLPPHPSADEFVDLMEVFLPRHLVLKHVPVSDAADLGDYFDNLFHWTNDGTHEHSLYDAGNWVAPPWMTDNSESLIRRRNYRESGPRIPIDRPVSDLPEESIERAEPDLEAEGVPVSLVDKRFGTDLDAGGPAQPATSDGGQTTARTDTSTEDSPGQDALDAVPEDLDERLTALENHLDDVADALPDTDPPVVDLSPVEDRLDALEAQVAAGDDVAPRLDALEATVDSLPARLDTQGGTTVPGTVVRQDDLVMVRLDEAALEDADADFEHDDPVDVSLSPTDPQADD
jgi:putative mRNA 3-end processing factor